MSTEAILNVEADQLAGEYQDDLGPYSPITYMYRSSPVVLEINGLTIPNHMRHHLIKAYSEPQYIHYFQQKKGTQQDSEFNSIEMFEPGIAENRQRHNDLLPTIRTLLKWKWQDYDNCCLC